MVLVCCFRKEHPGMKKNFFVYSIKVLSVMLSSLAAATSFIACGFAVVHLVSLYGSQLPLRRPELSRGRQHTHHPRHIFVRLQLYSRRFGSVVRLPTLGQ
jgi:hypothetical protein